MAAKRYWIEKCKEQEKEIERLRNLCVKASIWLSGEDGETNAEFIAEKLSEESKPYWKPEEQSDSIEK